MQITPIRLEKASRTSLEEREMARFSGGDASFRASLKNVDRFLMVIWKIKILWMTRQHTRLCSQYNVMYKRSKIRGLWHTFGCSTDDERSVYARARWARVRTPKTHPGFDTRVPGCDVWAASSSGYESRRRTGGEVPKNLVNESRREKRDKERDIHVCIYLEKREARGAIDEATNKVRVPFDRKREREEVRKRHLGCHRERPLFHEMQSRKV